MAELDGAMNLVGRFVQAGGANGAEYMVKGGSTYRLVRDHLGSVRLVVDANAGTVAQQIDYDEFGVVTKDTNPGFQPFGFAGGLYDPDTGLVRFGARDYDASVGRWTARDPILFEGSPINLYAYVGNDPVNGVDPSGRDVLLCKLFINAITAVCLAGCLVLAEAPPALAACFLACFAGGAYNLANSCNSPPPLPPPGPACRE